MSMAASIESRVPFLDDRLVDHVARLPARLKLRGWRTKAVLRARRARSAAARRSSRAGKWAFPSQSAAGFATRTGPSSRSSSSAAGLATRRLLPMTTGSASLAEAHRRGEAEHGDRLWLLINLEIWQRIFTDGDWPADVMRLVRRRRPRLVSSRTVRAAVH